MRSAIAGAALLCFVSGCGEAEPPLPPQAPVHDEPATTALNLGWRVRPFGDVNDFLDCAEASDAAIISAHRGGPAPGFPENAIETFTETLRQAPALIELDVATSADGVLYLMHDDTLDRTTIGSGETNESDWNEIKRLPLLDNDGERTEFRPPSFADALAYLKDRTVTQVDFKRTTKFEDVIDEINRQDAADQVILIAYSLAQARKLHRLAPDMMISLSIDNEDELNSAVAAGVPEDRLVAFTGTDEAAPRLYALLESRDVEVIFGTLGRREFSIDNQIERSGREETYAELAAAGVDIIATDRPTPAYNALVAADRALEDGECGVSAE